MSTSCSEAALRARVVEVARAEVGKRDLQRYFADAAPVFLGASGAAPEWCGIFALYCLHQAGLLRDKTWKVGLGFLETAPPLPKVSVPKPGDIAYYTQYQHEAVVLSVDGGRVELANGNGQGGVVSLSWRPMSEAAAYYSIRNAIEAAIQKGCPP